MTDLQAAMNFTVSILEPAFLFSMPDALANKKNAMITQKSD